MEIKNPFQKFLSKFSKKHSGDTRPRSRFYLAGLHWQILIIVFFVSMVVVSINSVLVYHEISEGELGRDGRINSTKTKFATAEQLQKTADAIEIKKDQFEKVRDIGITAVDPSR